MKEHKPSRTALSVAANLLMLSYDPTFGPLVSQTAIEPTRWCLRSLPGLSGRMTALFEYPWMRAYMRRIEQSIVPGVSIHTAVRKRWIEEQVSHEINHGCTQVIVLGAGFDTLAYRLHDQFRNVRWWEIDHPATHQVKRQALTTHGNLQPNLTLIPVDFTQKSLTNVLATTPLYDPQARTIFIAEGLLMYLEESDVRTLLHTIHTSSGPNSTIVGSILAPKPDGRLGVQKASWFVDLGLKLAGEPFKWGVAPDDLPVFMNDNAFENVKAARTSVVVHSYLAVPSHVTLYEGEYLFLARRKNA
ncbi:MAG: SAM-dependent methyltransferase [Chloroflexota bacterium]